MEQFLQNNFTLVIFLLFGVILLLISVLVVVLVYLVMRERKNSTDQIENTDKSESLSTKKTKVNLDSLKEQQSSAYCSIHKDEQAVGTCSICEQAFCDHCLMEYEHLRFCPEHFRTYTNNKWVDITNIKTTPDETENAMPIYQLKREIWEKEDIPTFIETDYKINVEGDFVESYVKLFVREEDKAKLQERLKNLKVH